MEAPSSLIDILNHSPSAELLKAKYREQLILFFATVFSEEHKVVAQETLYQYLSDFLDHLLMRMRKRVLKLLMRRLKTTSERGRIKAS